jgi:hypothetical protein
VVIPSVNTKNGFLDGLGQAQNISQVLIQKMDFSRVWARPKTLYIYTSPRTRQNKEEEEI